MTARSSTAPSRACSRSTRSRTRRPSSAAAGRGYRGAAGDRSRHAEERFDTYSAQRDRLTSRVNRQRQWSEARRQEGQGLGPGQEHSCPGAPSARRSRRAGPRLREGARAASRSSTSRGSAGSCSCASAAASASGDVTARLEHAVLRRGTFTLGPLDLEVAWGERIALVGPNGSGKTTLRAGADRHAGAASRGHALARPRRARRARSTRRARASTAPARCSTRSSSRAA